MPNTTDSDEDMDVDMEEEEEDMENVLETTESLYEYNNFSKLPPNGLTPTEQPARSESGESHRSQTRRFAAGHAEMQRSVFLSTRNEVELETTERKHKSKSPPEEATVGSMEDSTTCDAQPPKRPRRYAREPGDAENR